MRSKKSLLQVYNELSCATATMLASRMGINVCWSKDATRPFKCYFSRAIAAQYYSTLMHKHFKSSLFFLSDQSIQDEDRVNRKNRNASHTSMAKARPSTTKRTAQIPNGGRTKERKLEIYNYLLPNSRLLLKHSENKVLAHSRFHVPLCLRRLRSVLFVSPNSINLKPEFEKENI